MPTHFNVGTAGWSYLRWEKEFYPHGTRPNEKLAYYARQFNAVELNNSFYRVPAAEQFRRWGALVPAGFRFAVKAPRLITHTKRLNDPGEALPHFLGAIALPKTKAGPVFFQLPPVFPLDLPRLKHFLEHLPRGRYAMEFRDPAWHIPEVYDLLEKRNIAFCLYDTPDGVSPRVVTADFTYVRLRGRKSRRLAAFLEEWRQWLHAQGNEAYVFFDNREEKNLAFGNALQFRAMTR